MSQPDEVTLLGYAIAGGNGRLTPNPHAWPTREPLDETVKSWGGMSGGPFRVVALYSESAYLALLTRVEATEGALAWIAAQSCRRDAPCLELNACATERCETCYARLALRASGTREGE